MAAMFRKLSNIVLSKWRFASDIAAEHRALAASLFRHVGDQATNLHQLHHSCVRRCDQRFHDQTDFIETVDHVGNRWRERVDDVGRSLLTTDRKSTRLNSSHANI